MKLISSLIQLFSIGMVIYITYFKSEITEHDFLRCIFFMGLYVVEDVRQLRYQIFDNNTNKNED